MKGRAGGMEDGCADSGGMGWMRHYAGIDGRKSEGASSMRKMKGWFKMAASFPGGALGVCPRSQRASDADPSVRPKRI